MIVFNPARGFGEQTMEQIAAAIGSDRTSNILYDLIDGHARVAKEQKMLYDRYTQESVPIFDRRLPNQDKVNNKLATDWLGDIVDTKQGYMGNQIAIELDKQEYENKAEYERINGAIDEFELETNAGHINSELVKMAALTGLSAKLLYLSDGELKQMPVYPWECIFIYGSAVKDITYAMRYYMVTRDGEEVIRVEWYDATLVTEYEQERSERGMGGPAIPQNNRPRFVQVGQQPHGFTNVPLIPFPNNEQQMGDAKKVLSLIDGYDRTISDVNSEVEQFRLSYLALKDAGGQVDRAFVETLKQTGVIPLGENGEAMFVTKDLNDQIIEHHLDRLEMLIERFAKTVDLREALGGHMPVIAYHLKMFALEQKCLITERLFKSAMRYQWTLLQPHFAAKGIVFDVNDINFVFSRQKPQDIAGEVKFVAEGSGHISRRTLYSQVSFIDDPEEEEERLKEEQQEKIDLYESMNGDTESERQSDIPGNREDSRQNGARGRSELQDSAR